MSKLNPDQREIIHEFYQTIRELHPDLTLKECLEICRSPFDFAKEMMKRPDYPEINYRYFGSFQLKPFHAYTTIQRLEKVKEKRGDNPIWQQKIDQLKDYLVRNPITIYAEEKKKQQLSDQQTKTTKKEQDEREDND